MELNTHICRQLTEKARAFTQITLDDDYIVRDNKPDVVRVIYSKGDIELEDAKVGNQVVWVTGKLRFAVLYQSDDENRRLDSITGEVPFQEKLVMENVGENDEASVDVQMEDLSIGIINSRKLVVRAVLNITADMAEEEEIAIACETEDVDYRQKSSQLPMMCLVANTRDVMHVAREFSLPNSRTNIGELMFYQADFRNEDIQLQNDKALVQMDVNLWICYRSESTGEYECFETVTPVSGEVDLPGANPDDVFWAKITPMETVVEPRGDYDGEARMVGMDLSLGVELQVYREEVCALLRDAYSLEKELVLEREPIFINQLLMKNVSKVRLMEQVKLEPTQERILQICGASGDITIDRTQRQNDGVMVEGILNVHILYNTVDDTMPFAHHSSQIPFEQFVELEGLSEDAVICVNGKVEQLQVNLLDPAEYEVKALLQISVLAMNKVPIENILSIREEPMDMDALQKQPGMIGYVRRPGEELWDVAKKYHATPENIIEIGSKVLVVKQVQ